MMARKFLIFFFILNLFASALFSQQYFFRKYSAEEGLSQSSVYCLLQDSRGYIWMGTDGGGLARFDGNRFETFTVANGLTDNIIRSLFEDSNGNIWIGTQKGLTIYDGAVFTPVTKEMGLAGTSVLKITETLNGIILVGTNDGGLSAIKTADSLSITNFSADNGLINNFIYDIYEAPDKRIWLAMFGGINIIQLSETDSLYIKDLEDPIIPAILDNFVLSIAPGENGSFLIGTHSNGLFIAVPGKNGYEINPSSINKKFPDLTIWDIAPRTDGEIWLATDTKGIIRLAGDEIKGILNKENGLPSNQIMNILIDDEGNTWLGTYDQGAIMFKDQKFIAYGSQEGIPGNQVLNIFFDQDDKFYTATEEGFTCFEKDGEKIKRISFLTSISGLNDVGATAITKYDNRTWIGTNNGINVFDGIRLSAFPLNSKLPDKTINTLLADNHHNLWIGTRGGFSRYKANKLYSMNQDEGLIHNEVQTIIEDSRGGIWMGTIGGLVKVNDTISITNYQTGDGLTSLWINTLAEDPAGNIWIGTFGGGIFKFDIKADTIPITVIATEGTLSSNNINTLFFVNDTTVIAGTDKGFNLLELDDKQSIRRVVHFGINDGFKGGENNQNSIAKDNEGLIWFGTKNGLVRYDPSIEVNYNQLPRTLFSGMKLFFQEVDWESRNIKTAKWTGMPENLVLSHNDNNITFLITGFFYNNPGDLMFSYYLDPQSKEWSPYTPGREIQLPGLSPGNYKIKVRARNKYGIIGEAAEYSFIVKPPFYKTKWFIISSSLLLLLIIFTFFRVRERNLIKEKIKLEKIVKERTREVVEQKDEIARQRDLVTSQKKEITDSINYAERIQNAVLPDDSILGKVFSDYFIILRPKDIVSGDFYWMSLKNNMIVFAAADCTGHGVPGAFMSMLGVSFLNKIVNESSITEPSAILNSLRENVISALKQSGSFHDAKDGMDIALCSMDVNRKKLQFAGANNPLYLIRKDNSQYNLIEEKGNMMPVGVYSNMNAFTCHEIDIQKGDTIYLFSDGFLDQFGGPDGRKFMKTRFRQMLLDNQESDMSVQKEIFNKILDDWINCPSENIMPSGQVDDIILIGIRI
ncbi:MAG: SpoIIE family protein phosphatase [Bacteroidia bacterium]|nr:SpoIIE family protein phosphatase [Bacteroidia bacterium]